jgi:hypothetical protein
LTESPRKGQYRSSGEDSEQMSQTTHQLRTIELEQCELPINLQKIFYVEKQQQIFLA